MPATDTSTPSDRGLQTEVELLKRMLAVQIDAQRTLLSCVQQKREAIRTANIDTITALCQQENEIIQKVATLEKKRLALVGRITQRVSPQAAKPLSLNEIADAAGDGLGPRLRTQAQTLREAIQAVRRESSIVNAAAATLSRHMAGIMQTVNSALSRIGVYERKGRISVGTQMDFRVDLKS